MQAKELSVQIRAAQKNEAIALSEIAWRSKGYWGYDEEFLRDCGELLNIKGSYIEENLVYVAQQQDGKLIGFYGVDLDSDLAQMYYLHVDPDFIGQGVGRLLWEHALQTLKEKGFQSFKIHSDPNAEQFFKYMGAEHVGERPSRFRVNRVIPILQYNL